MEAMQVVEDLSKKYGVPVEELIRVGAELTLKERKKGYLCERLEILSRYSVTSVQELENRIQQGEVPDHPAWEDLIEVKNLEAEVKEIDRDLGAVQAA
ncbi:MAG: hypothetical protein IH977_04680 [Nitrospinae bacterium]|nr:hypothetical protein [Nitrospinota bacterium]